MHTLVCTVADMENDSPPPASCASRGAIPIFSFHDLDTVPQSIGKLTNENFPNFAGVYTPHFAINPHFLSNYDCTHSVLCNLTFTLFVLAMVTVSGFSLVSDPMKTVELAL